MRPRLAYFPIYGRGEVVRLLLTYLKIDFDEDPQPLPLGGPVEKAKWEQQRHNFEFKYVPVLHIDGHSLSSSMSILRYLARKHKMHPTDPYDLWRVDSMCDHYLDLEIALQNNSSDTALDEYLNGKNFKNSLNSIQERIKANIS